MDHAPRSYRASSDAALDPIRRLDHSATLVVMDGDRPAEPIGRARLAGWILDRGTPAATYSLNVGGEEVSGLFVRVERRFEPITVTPDPPEPE